MEAIKVQSKPQNDRATAPPSQGGIKGAVAILVPQQ
jgi:hypothetical protein